MHEMNNLDVGAVFDVTFDFYIYRFDSIPERDLCFEY